MTHGGDIRALSLKASCKQDDLLDFSASINPLGPPTEVSTILSRSLDLIVHYPDPSATELRQAIAQTHNVSPGRVVAGNGSSELLAAIARVFPQRRWVLSEPCYGGYEIALRSSAVKVDRISRIGPEFDIDWSSLQAVCAADSLVVLDHPNNPTGRPLDFDRLANLIRNCSQAIFVIDDSFASFISKQSPAVQFVTDNVIVMRSMTKFYAIPGLRLGYAIACEDIAKQLTRQLPEWNVNAIAQHCGTHCINDEWYANRTRKRIAQWRETLAAGLAAIPNLEVYPSSANFILCRLPEGKVTAQVLSERLLQADRIAIRVCDTFGQLGERYFRVAVRTEEENHRLIDALMRILYPERNALSGVRHSTKRRTPALMIQGVSSNAGKSIIAAAFCRILAREGVRVAPFKSQNMSLNSFVTRDGHEISRAQVVQAQAAKLEPDVRMNPVLLKPNSQKGSQVIIDGQPIGNMRVKEYYQFKPQAFEHAKRAYDSLADEYDLIVLEGAGSPGEVNLKRYDIVNMNMACHAGASVVLVGDIDRGGVFASFVGTMAVLEAWERRLVAGYIVNRFRGDASLLDDAYTYMLQNTGKPVLGTVPNISDLAIPDEDSVTFKQDVSSPSIHANGLDIAVIDLPHISNLSDFDPLKAEPDVHVRTVRKPSELGMPDAVILPGSRNTIHDLQYLRRQGFEATLQTVMQQGRTEMIGICGGFQMLGRSIRDTSGVESARDQTIDGFGMLDVVTELAAEKTLRQVTVTHTPSEESVTGYEIHHGNTSIGDVSVMLELEGSPLAVSIQSEKVWGTYLHGTFEQDGFRRWLLNRMRKRKGMPPLEEKGASYNLDVAYDELADIVAANVDLKSIYEFLGL